MIVIDVRNAELMGVLAMEARERGLMNAAIVSLIGGVDSFTVSTMPTGDATKDVITEYAVPAEMHGSGEIRGGAVHVHATFGVEGDRAVVGHVHAAHIGTHFARAYLIPME